jgi:hypothetical protein
LQVHQGEQLIARATKCELSGKVGDPDRNPVDVCTSPVNNLLMSVGHRTSDLPVSEAELNSCATGAGNQSLAEAQKELLCWCFHLGHLNFKTAQFLLRTGTLSWSDRTKHLHTAASRADLPKCAACQFGEQVRRPAPGKVSGAAAG